jgi:peptidoglycan/LPS O-acetylase OafA/YrhL
MTIRRKSSYIQTLDGWRAIAVSLVIGAHCYTMLLNSRTRAGALAAKCFGHTGYGVDIFFALSGYLIASYYCVEEPMIRLGHKLASSPGERQSGRYASTSEAASAILDAS